MHLPPKGKDSLRPGRMVCVTHPQPCCKDGVHNSGRSQSYTPFRGLAGLSSYQSNPMATPRVKIAQQAPCRLYGSMHTCLSGMMQAHVKRQRYFMAAEVLSLYIYTRIVFSVAPFLSTLKHSNR